MGDEEIIAELKNTIKSYPDFPKTGIIFRDIFPVLLNPRLFDNMIYLFQKWLSDHTITVDCVVGLDSRGFLLGPSLCQKMKVPFVPIRKAGKLPGIVKKESYSLEYGSDALEIQVESIKKNGKVLIIDDLLATGGTLGASVKLIESIGAVVVQCFVVVELESLNGRQKVSAPVHSLCCY